MEGSDVVVVGGGPMWQKTARKWALGALLLHHLVVWVNLSLIRFVQVDEEAKGKLKVYKDFGPRFLTNWNFFNQTAYIFVALLTEVKPPARYEKQLERLRRLNWHTFWSLVLPWTVFIAALFWGVYNYDRELIFPRIVDRIFPVWMNHAVHTNILLLLIVEVLLVKGKPPRIGGAVKTLTVYALVYVFVLCYTFLNNRVWLYGFVRVLDWPQRIVMFLGIYVVLVAIMLAGISVQGYKHRSVQRIKAQ